MSDLDHISTETLVKELKRRGNLHYAVANQSIPLMDLEFAGPHKQLMEQDTRRWVAESIGRLIWRSGDFPIEERDSEVFGTRTYSMTVPVLLFSPKLEWPGE